ncbi:hypothetical protein KIS1582_1144 [Cytobacillus firmus]|uniref:Uncharacterized protein n=1 Tax=Cytobacillus firmus TaxID=1399 RepID=A0A800NDX6_CYTFI|nr:hypothetical protein KIS1582_1144 [Cytobacillus firmus]
MCGFTTGLIAGIGLLFANLLFYLQVSSSICENCFSICRFSRPI